MDSVHENEQVLFTTSFEHPTAYRAQIAACLGITMLMTGRSSQSSSDPSQYLRKDCNFLRTRQTEKIRMTAHLAMIPVARAVILPHSSPQLPAKSLALQTLEELTVSPAAQ